MKMIIEQHPFKLKSPFSITGYTFTDSRTIRVTLEDEGHVGRGEANGIYYRNETESSMSAQLGAVEDAVVLGATCDEIQSLLPLGGARNALDCAMWDLTAKRNNFSIWELLKIKPKPLATVATLGISSPNAMAEVARQYSKYKNLKIKLNNDGPIERLEAIRAARPDANIIIDVNQGWTFNELKEYTPAALKLDIAMIEQPLPRGADDELEGYKSIIPLGADESCLDASEYEVAARRYDVINIKLDKCGGLTEGMKMVKLAQRDGKGLMVGNMSGSSLGMAPAFVVGQFCQFIDIDGPILLKQDIENGLHYGDGGLVGIPSQKLWG